MMTDINFRLIPLLALLFLGACSEQKPKNELAKPYLQAAEIITLEPQSSYVITRTFIGEVNAKHHTKLSFEYGGIVEKIFVDSSDTVEQGQILANLDTQLLHIKKQELLARIKQVNAQLVLNNANLKRVKDLKNKGYGSEQSVDELTAEKAVLLATIEQLNANMSNIDYQLDKSVITAPYAGMINQRLISQGDLIANGQTSFTLIALDDHQITLGIPADIAQRLSLEQHLPIEIANVKTTATVIAIGQHINTINRTVQIRLQLNNDNEVTYSSTNLDGQIARVMIDETIPQAGFWLPLSAITDGVRGQWNILVAKPSSTGQSRQYQLHSATVTIAHTDNNQAFLIGLPDQALEVVASGLHRYVANQTVRKVNIEEQGQ